MATTSVAASIDGREVEVDCGTTILEAAERAGIAIPTLCYDAAAGKRGACRLCVVEIEGQHELAPACHTPLRQGAVIATRSPRVLTARRTLIELAIAGVKMEGGLINTQLRELVAEYGADPARFSGEKKSKGLLQEDPLLVRDPARCIRCDRCLRYCDANQGVGAIAPIGRGGQSHIATFFDNPLTATNCQHCGGCATRMPDRSDQRALALRVRRGRAPRTDVVPLLRNRLPNLCTRCRWPDHRRRTGGRRIAINKNDLCVKGRLAFDFLTDPDRITTPLIRDPAGGSRFPGFREASWDEALGLVADRLTAIKTQYGPQAIMGISSSRGTNEENYIFQKFMRAVLGTNNVDNCARVCHSPSVTGLAAVFGGGAASNSLDEIQDTQVLLLVGCNPTEAHPVIGMRIKRAAL